MDIQLGELFEIRHPISHTIEMWEAINVSGSRIELRAITGSYASDLDRTLSASSHDILKFRSNIGGPGTWSQTSFETERARAKFVLDRLVALQDRLPPATVDDIRKLRDVARIGNEPIARTTSLAHRAKVFVAVSQILIEARKPTGVDVSTTWAEAIVESDNWFNAA